MHLYLLTRGIKNAVDTMIRDLQSKYVPIYWREKDGSMNPNKFLQIGVRPIQLWEIVFPEEQRDVVYRSILSSDKTQHKKHEKWISMIRRILGVKKIKKWEKDGNKMIIAPGDIGDIEIIPIGEKKDYWLDESGKHTKDKRASSLHEGI